MAGPAARPGRERLRRCAPAGARPPGTDVAAVTAELASLVRGGIPPPAAWAAVATGLADDHAGRVLVGGRRGGARGEPVAGVLRGGLGPAPGARRSGDDGGLATLAATVAVHERTGAPVADLLDRAAAGLRADADARLARRRRSRRRSPPRGCWWRCHRSGCSSAWPSAATRSPCCSPSRSARAPSWGLSAP